MPDPVTPDASSSSAEYYDVFHDGDRRTSVASLGRAGERQFRFDNGHETRDVIEPPARPYTQTGSPVFDGLFALAMDEVRQNSVSAIRAQAFNDGRAFQLEAFETGELWQYVWTRDVSYAADLALAGLDAPRCLRSLRYKTSNLKAAAGGGDARQILQDTGTGGSYPVSTDRVIWALAAERVSHFLPKAEQADWIVEALPILRATIEQDRRLIFDPATGLYRGEQSFLDWREQTYPGRTKENVLAIAMSLSLSTNVAHFIILTTAAAWSTRQGGLPDADRYAGWATALAAAINTQLYDQDAGLYATFLLTDVTATVRTHRYDLLGQALAILTGIAGPERARRIIETYPTGPFGPAVVWPQEPTVPIYHNHAIWPFVTAYWIKAARHAGHAAAVAAGVRSLARGAALHLSNMENLDFASGDLDGHSHGLRGPAINSRRQLWSVAGYVSMVQDVLFGMETTADGIRFRPFLPADTRAAFFGAARSVRLCRVDYHGKCIDLTLHLPAGVDAADLECDRTELNGRTIDDGFVPADALGERNDWSVRMKPAASPAGAVRLFTDFVNPRALFGPPEPAWRPLGQDGIDEVDGRLRLNYEPAGDRDVVYNVYRDGRCVARHVTATEWVDPQSADFRTNVRQYAVEAVYPDTGNHSHLSDTRLYWPVVPQEPPFKRAAVVCSAEAVVLSITVTAAGVYALRLKYANGNGAINTGLTCAVKRVDVTTDAGMPVAGGYLTMPQTGGRSIVQWSSPLVLPAIDRGGYRVRVGEDDVSLNMSDFAHNAAYTGHEGGGDSPCNAVSIEDVRLWPIAYSGVSRVQ